MSYAQGSINKGFIMNSNFASFLVGAAGIALATIYHQLIGEATVIDEATANCKASDEETKVANPKLVSLPQDIAQIGADFSQKQRNFNLQLGDLPADLTLELLNYKGVAPLLMMTSKGWKCYIESDNKLIIDVINGLAKTFIKRNHEIFNYEGMQIDLDDIKLSSAIVSEDAKFYEQSLLDSISYKVVKSLLSKPIYSDEGNYHYYDTFPSISKSYEILGESDFANKFREILEKLHSLDISFPRVEDYYDVLQNRSFSLLDRILKPGLTYHIDPVLKKFEAEFLAKKESLALMNEKSVVTIKWLLEQNYIKNAKQLSEFNFTVDKLYTLNGDLLKEVIKYLVNKGSIQEAINKINSLRYRHIAFVQLEAINFLLELLIEKYCHNEKIVTQLISVRTLGLRKIQEKILEINFNA